MKTFPIVLVDWVDAVFDSKAPPKPLLLHTVGFLYYQDDDHITLAMENRDGDFEGDESFRDYLTIPSQYIKNMTILIESRSKRNKMYLAKSKML